MASSLTQTIARAKKPNETMTQCLHRLRKEGESITQTAGRLARGTIDADVVEPTKEIEVSPTKEEPILVEEKTVEQHPPPTLKEKVEAITDEQIEEVAKTIETPKKKTTTAKKKTSTTAKKKSTTKKDK